MNTAAPVQGDPQAVATRRKTSGLSPRIVLLSLLVAPACCFWAQDNGISRIFSLMVPPVVLTLVLIGANVVLRRFTPRFAFTETELIVFYAMQTVICAMASEWMDVISPYIHTYGVFADRDQRYKTKVLPYISEWLFFTSDEGLKDFATGGKPLRYMLSSLGIWWPKIIAWTIVAGLVCMAFLCVNSLMRDQWCNREKLAFPLVQLPIAMTQEGGAGPMWRNRYFLTAFGVMFAIDMLNGFAFLYPSIPRINVRFLGDVLPMFNSQPWNQIGWTPIGLFPFMAAIGLFMPNDLLFSCIFFFFARKGMQVIAAAMGYEQGVFGGGGLIPSAPYFSEQSWGAFLGLFVMALWVARGYLKEVWREIVRTGTPDKRLVPHRLSFAGLVLSLGALGWIGVEIGLPFFFVLGYTALFLMFSIAMTRLRAQLGPPIHEMAFMGPTQLLVDFRGTQGVSTSMIARTVTLFHFMNRIHRTHPMPHQLEAIKIADRAGMSQRAMFAALILATIAGSIFGHLARIYISYRFTPANVGGDTANVIAVLTDTPRPPNVAAMAAVGAGFMVVLGLDFVRFRVPGFPFHPAGYALAMNFGLDYVWFGLTIVLAIKAFVQRYYGLPGYDKLRMVAFGIILGEFLAEGIWATYSMVTRTAAYSISINGKLGWNQ
jgi:hypothetical protein